MPVSFIPLSTETACGYRRGTADSYGLTPEHVASSAGSGTPCRHCLAQVPEGRPYLIVAHRPFTGVNPYTETGPIFLCADDCDAGGPEFPEPMLSSTQYITRGYSAEERIIYGTGAVVSTDEIKARCEALFTRDDVTFIHIRSASNNCFQCRVERA